MSNWKYDTFLWTMSVLVDLFFREVHPRGSWKVPRHGPVLFVAAPHANQVRALLLSFLFLLFFPSFYVAFVPAAGQCAQFFLFSWLGARAGY